MLVVVFGQELPDATASFVDQLFSLVVAFIGLGAFALVLALVEQVVLEVSAAIIRSQLSDGMFSETNETQGTLTQYCLSCRTWTTTCAQAAKYLRLTM